MIFNEGELIQMNEPMIAEATPQDLLLEEEYELSFEIDLTMLITDYLQSMRDISQEINYGKTAWQFARISITAAMKMNITFFAWEPDPTRNYTAKNDAQLFNRESTSKVMLF